MLKPDWQRGISCAACDVFSKGILVLLPGYLFFFFFNFGKDTSAICNFECIRKQSKQ